MNKIMKGYQKKLFLFSIGLIFCLAVFLFFINGFLNISYGQGSGIFSVVKTGDQVFIEINACCPCAPLNCSWGLSYTSTCGGVSWWYPSRNCDSYVWQETIINPGICTYCGFISCDNSIINTTPPCVTLDLCQNDCSLGQTKCYGSSSYYTCGYYDSDSCLDWSEFPVICGDNACGGEGCSLNERPQWSCTGGVCSHTCVVDSNCVSCTNDCSPEGTTQCVDSTHRQRCGNYDTDVCLEWGTPFYDLTCTTCVNECSPSGKIECVGAGSTRTCGEYDNTDTCLEWSAPMACGSTSCGTEGCSADKKPQWSCSGGVCSRTCVSDPACVTCTDECSPSGKTECVGTGSIRSCGEYDNTDTCLEWSNSVLCSGDTSCDYLTCSITERSEWYCLSGTTGAKCDYRCKFSPTCCTDDCSSSQVRCSDDTHFQACGDYDSDDCLEWPVTSELCQGDTNCGYGTCLNSQKPVWYCSAGACRYYCSQDLSCSTCVNECSSGQTRCSGLINYQTCGDYDSDSCLEWPLTSQSCVGDTSCGAETCNEGEKPSWSCFNNACRFTCFSDASCLACSNECSSGDIRCVDSSYYQQCANYDSDPCSEWPVDSQFNKLCSGDTTTCSYGNCSDNQKATNWRCENNACVYSCVDSPACGIAECSLGQQRCFSATEKQICTSQLRWGEPTSCAVDNSCGYGDCSEDQKPFWYCFLEGECKYLCIEDSSCETISCVDECSYGEKQCFGSDSIKVCGEYDYTDNCLEWSSPTSCLGNSSCGSESCDGTERPSWYCNASTNQCDSNCVYDSSCDSGPTCQDKCEQGVVECFDANKWWKCDDYNLDGCYEWSSPTSCVGSTACGSPCSSNKQKPSWYCANGVCSFNCVNALECGGSCDDECDSPGQSKCFDFTRKQICRDTNGDGCLEWDAPEFCAVDVSCGDGICADNEKPVWRCIDRWCSYDCVLDNNCCVNQCSWGQFQCADNSNEQTCGYYGSCLSWSSPRFCQGDTTCGYEGQYGNCADSERPNWYCSLITGACAYNCVQSDTCGQACDNDCSLGETVCFTDDAERICNYFGDDDCLHWSAPRVCEGNTSCGFEECSDTQKPQWACINGKCDYTCVEDATCSACVNECPERWLTRCVTNTQRQVCGIFWDEDPCLEWYPPELCEVLNEQYNYCGYEECSEIQKPYWYCDDVLQACNYGCSNDSSCVSGYIKEFKKDCYDDDVYWFDSEDQVQDKIEECEDDNSETIDGCEFGSCFHWSEEEHYCRTQDHCGDGICNCEEDFYTCFEDCESAVLEISVFAKRQSEKEWLEELEINPGENIDILFVVINNSPNDLDNVIVKAQLSQEIFYEQGVRVEEISLEEDIRQGVNIGFLSSGAERKINFRSQISSKAEVGVQAQLIGTVEMGDLSDSDSLNIDIIKAQKGFWETIKWLFSRWYIWLLLWILFIIILFLILKRRKKEEEEESDESLEGIEASEQNIEI